MPSSSIAGHGRRSEETVGIARRATSLAKGFVAATLLGVPAGILIGLFLTPERLDGSVQTPLARVEPAGVVDFDERTGVAATLAWIEGPSLHAPAWVGTVGQVGIRPQETIRTGQPVASIDGITRLAVASPQPFFRRLSLGDQGPDVEWLQQSLGELGYLQQDPDPTLIVSQETVEAVRALAVALGVAGPVDSFDPGWFVWLPDESFEVVSVALTVGAPAPFAGTPLAVGAAQLGTVSLQRLDGGPLSMEPGIAYVLEVENEQLPLDPDTGVVDGEGLARLSAILPPLVDSVSASVRRARPLSVWALPSTAVMAGADGRLCIWVDAGQRYESLPVEVVAGRAGVTFVRPSAAVAVLHNPAQMLSDPACPSS